MRVNMIDEEDVRRIARAETLEMGSRISRTMTGVIKNRVAEAVHLELEKRALDQVPEQEQGQEEMPSKHMEFWTREEDEHLREAFGEWCRYEARFQCRTVEAIKARINKKNLLWR